MTTEASVVRWLDEILPLAMQPTPSGARLDPRLYFREGPDGRWLGVTVTDADGKQVGRTLPIDKQESIGGYFDGPLVPYLQKLTQDGGAAPSSAVRGFVEPRVRGACRWDYFRCLGVQSKYRRTAYRLSAVGAEPVLRLASERACCSCR
jgi:hypothetical protein